MDYEKRIIKDSAKSAVKKRPWREQFNSLVRAKKARKLGLKQSYKVST